MSVRVREATRADLGALVALQEPALGVDAWSPRQVEEELDRPGGMFLVAEGDGIVGFAIGWVVFDELQLLLIAVDPARRREGIARALHAALLRAVPHAEVGWLEVRVDNTAAIGLYLGLGWTPMGRRPRYYADGTDAALMRLGITRAA